jgi:membrane carboxypeptidase/penicillin-binding protein
VVHMPPVPRRHSAVRRFLIALALGAVSIAVLATGYFALEVRQARQDTASIVHKAWARHGHVLRLRDVEPERLQWLLAVEDPAFFHHHGVDVSTPGAGMTTISQGLVKLLYFPEGFKPGFAKLRQTLIARYAFDAKVSKQEQLELLLNMAYLGEHQGRQIHGFDRAAQAYFGKRFKALSDEEYLSLVAMLMAPKHLHPGTPSHDERMRRIRAVLAGKYQPVNVADVAYEGNVELTFFQTLFARFVQLIA